MKGNNMFKDIVFNVDVCECIGKGGVCEVCCFGFVLGVFYGGGEDLVVINLK